MSACTAGKFAVFALIQAFGLNADEAPLHPLNPDIGSRVGEVSCAPEDMAVVFWVEMKKAAN